MATITSLGTTEKEMTQKFAGSNPVRALK